jgi:hypothetical protein
MKYSKAEVKQYTINQSIPENNPDLLKKTASNMLWLLVILIRPSRID